GHPADKFSRHPHTPITVITHDGPLLPAYNRVHLVPFGEYLPFQSLLERLGLQQLTKVQSGFLAGDRRRALASPRAPKFVPLICYEIIFPHDAVPPGERGGWLLNLTNDAWVGMSAGPCQPFQEG